YLFGALLFWRAWSQARSGNEHGAEEGDSRLIRILRRIIPTSKDYDGDRLTTKVDGKRLFTPMLLVMVAI
ncbi:TerC family protein, partial [Bacillus sp. S34]|nr:TerC family protein [Bacillus sp. S34]